MENGKDSDDHLGARIGTEANGLVQTDTEFSQSVGEVTGVAGEFSEGIGLFPEINGALVGTDLYLR